MNNTSHKHGIMIVDDHPLMREGIARLINEQKDLQVCCEANSAGQARERLESFKPDLVLMDLKLKDASGLELIQTMGQKFPGMLTLVLSMHDEKQYAEKAIHAGARGYVMKTEEPETMLLAIRTVLKGKIYLSESCRELILQNMASFGKQAPDPVQVLSDREKEVFRLIGKGLTTKEIAAKLGLSPKTADVHRDNIRKKLQLPNNPQLVCKAVAYAQSTDADSP
ncbi:MAG: response regulator transcription factor [Lentisphaerota bacterium]